MKYTRYSKSVMNRFKNLKHIGSLDENDINVGVGHVGALACGDILKLYLYIVDDIILDAKIMVFGCMSAFTASEVMVDKIKGKNINVALNLDNKEISEYLNLPPIKHHCSVLAQECILKAIKNYHDKNNKKFNYKQNVDFFDAKEKDNSTSLIDKKISELFEEDEINVMIKNSYQVNLLSQIVANINIQDSASSVIKSYIDTAYMRTKQRYFFKIFMKKIGCGYQYSYSFIRSVDVDYRYTVIESKIGFSYVYFAQEYIYMKDLKISYFVDGLESKIIFQKDNNITACKCGNTFNIGLI